MYMESRYPVGRHIKRILNWGTREISEATSMHVLNEPIVNVRKGGKTPTFLSNWEDICHQRIISAFSVTISVLIAFGVTCPQS